MVISYQQKIIQLGLNHSFKEISFVCGFVYLFVFLQPGCRVTGCLNGGSCFFDNDKETFVCSCTLSWHGERCELGRRAINSFQFSCLSYKNILRAEIQWMVLWYNSWQAKSVKLLFYFPWRYKHVFQQSMSVWGNVHHHFEWLHLRMLSIFHRPTVRDSSR